MKSTKSNILISAPFGYSVKNLLFSSFWESEVIRNSKVYILTPIPHTYEVFLKSRKIKNVEMIKFDLKDIIFSKLFDFIWEINKVRFLDYTHSNTQRIRWQGLKEHNFGVYLVKKGIIAVSKVFSTNQLKKILFKLTPEIKTFLPEEINIWLAMAPSFKEDLLVSKYLTQNKVACKRIAFMHSWDNFSSKGPLICDFDKIIVWGEAMREEMSRKVATLAEKIKIIGMPQYDILKNNIESITDNPYILYTTGHPNTIKNELLYIADILDVIKKDKLKLSLVVRVHPNDKIERYSELVKAYSFLRFEDPGIRTQETYDKWSPEEKDILHYGELIKNAKAIVNIASTVSLDASYFEKPVICLNYDKERSQIRQFYRYDHYKILLSFGGLYLCDSKKNLATLINAVITGHRLKEEQKNMFSYYDKFKDGKSGQRLGDLLQ